MVVEWDGLRTVNIYSTIGAFNTFDRPRRIATASASGNLTGTWSGNSAITVNRYASGNFTGSDSSIEHLSLLWW